MKITADTRTLSDALTRAARIAPTKGPSFHSAAGLLLEYESSAIDTLTVKATDLELTYRQEINSDDHDIKIEDTGSVRVPVVLAQVLATWPDGKVTITQDAKGLQLKQGKKKARLPVIATEYPSNIETFDPHDLEEVADFAQRVAQVEWACLRDDTPPMTGIHITGTHLVATDREKAATIPCDVPVAKPITIPLGPVTPLIANLEKLKLGATDRKLLMMPDPYTQITSTIYAVDYPDYARVQRDVDAEGVLTFEVPRQQLIDAVTGMLVLVKGEKLPIAKLVVRAKALGVHIDVEEVGALDDEVPVIDGPADAFTFHVTPRSLLGALGGSRCDVVQFSCGPDPRQPFIIRDEDGYRCDAMPRVVTKPGAPTSEVNEDAAAEEDGA